MEPYPFDDDGMPVDIIEPDEYMDLGGEYIELTEVPF